MLNKRDMKGFISGCRRMTPLWIPTCLCRTTGWSALKRTLKWWAPVRWTSTSSPLTYRDATSPLHLQPTVVREKVCVTSDQRVVFFSFYIHLPQRSFSPLPSVEELQLFPFSNSCRATQFSREVIRTQGEWEFLQISVTSLNVTYYGRTWEQLIYTVSNTRTNTDAPECMKWGTLMQTLSFHI